MVGIALITGINTVLVSAKQSVTQIADEQAKLDLIISGEQGGGGMPTFDPAVLSNTNGTSRLHRQPEADIRGAYARLAEVG